MTAPCSHLDQVRTVVAEIDGCEDCLRTGDSWVHLRLCLVCGHVGCCDSSKNRHATRHATARVIRSSDRSSRVRPGATATSTR